jgi:hypothetical protein
MNIFAEIDADQVLRSQLQRAKSEVESLGETHLSQVEDEDYSLRILSQVRIDPLHFRFDDAHISTHERMIPAEHHPGHRFFVQAGKSYPRQIIRYHLPFDGDSGLLRCIPNPRVMWTIDVDVRGDEIAFDIVNWEGDPEKVKREADQIFETIRKQCDHLTKQVEAFNTSAQGQIVQMLSKRREKLKKDSDFVSALGLPIKQPGKSHMPLGADSPTPKVQNKATVPDRNSSGGWDVFISHASEDKDAFVRDLANELATVGLKVWYDEFTLTLGDSLRRSIDQGLANTRFGIVVLSKSFFSKEWPQRELDGLVSKEIASGKLILPIWHKVSKEDVTAFSPILADRLAVSSEQGMDKVVKEILAAVNKKTG